MDHLLANWFQCKIQKEVRESGKRNKI